MAGVAAISIMAGRAGAKAIGAEAAYEAATAASAQAERRPADGLTSFAAARQTGAAWTAGFNELANTRVWPYLNASALKEGAEAAASIWRLRDMQMTMIGTLWALGQCNAGNCP